MNRLTDAAAAAAAVADMRESSEMRTRLIPQRCSYRRRLESRHRGHANKLRTATLGNPSEPSRPSDERRGRCKAPSAAAAH